MRIRVFQHVGFEDIGRIKEWAERKRHDLSYTRFFAGNRLPGTGDFDMLVVMGGPMSVNDTAQYPWLADEILFLRGAIAEGKKVFGVCLGAQLIAKSLGSEVYGNPVKEIGWFPVTFEPERHPFFPGLSHGRKLTVFHWHGETFDLPKEAIRLFSTDACANQAFAYSSNVLALQFHLEMSREAIDAIVANCRAELVQGVRIQPEALIVKQAAIYIEETSALLFDMLDAFTQ